jgi:hypothetical protein
VNFGTIPIKVHSEKSVDIDLSVPYLSNISTEKFVGILNEHSDCIASIRAAIAKVVKNLPGLTASDLNEARRGEIEPRLEELKRSFDRAIRSSKLRIGAATVATVGMSLAAIAGSPDGLAINSALGMTGLGLLASQYSDYRDKLAFLKDNPYYLFWKMSRTS